MKQVYIVTKRGNGGGRIIHGVYKTRAKAEEVVEFLNDYAVLPEIVEYELQ